jgi:hypothetical protein
MGDADEVQRKAGDRQPFQHAYHGVISRFLVALS